MTYSRHTGPRDRTLRVGDAERESVAETLRGEHLAGRLDDAELDARLASCFAAVSYADLDALLADLPDGEPHPRGDRARRFTTLPWPLLVAPLFVIAVIASHGHALWLVVPLAFLLVMRQFGGGVCGPWTGRRRAAR